MSDNFPAERRVNLPKATDQFWQKTHELYKSLAACFECARTSVYFQVWPNRAASFSSTESSVSAKIKTVQLHPPKVNTWEWDELYFHSYIFHLNATGHHICSKPLQLHRVIVLENLRALLGISIDPEAFCFPLFLVLIMTGAGSLLLHMILCAKRLISWEP